jgi:hypothetical protein
MRVHYGDFYSGILRGQRMGPNGPKFAIRYQISWFRSQAPWIHRDIVILQKSALKLGPTRMTWCFAYESFSTSSKNIYSKWALIWYWWYYKNIIKYRIMLEFPWASRYVSLCRYTICNCVALVGGLPAPDRAEAAVSLEVGSRVRPPKRTSHRVLGTPPRHRCRESFGGT